MLDVKKEMTFKEVQNFFSATDEFTVEDLSSKKDRSINLRLTLTDFAPRSLKEKVKCSTLMSTRITIQQLIRKVRQLCYNMAVKNYD